MTEHRPPPEAIDAAARAAILGEGSTEPLSVAGVTVFQALTGERPLEDSHVAAMARHTYDPESLCGLLFGGTAGRTWARSVVAAAGAPTDLKGLSRRLANIDARFRDRVEQVLAQAMRLALRRADVKVKVRSRRRVVTAAAIAPFAHDLEVRRYPPAMLAAINTTTDELMQESFDDAGEQIVVLFAVRQAARRAELAGAYGLEESDLEARWSQEEQRRGEAIAAFIVGAMFAEAVARLGQARDAAVFDPRGEVPVDPYVSPRITADTVRLADGATLAPPDPGEVAPRAINPPATNVEPSAPAARSGGDAPARRPSAQGRPARLYDYSDDLIDQVVGQMNRGAQTVYTWRTGQPANKFHPHHRLEGMTATDDTFWTVFAKNPSDFPEGNEAWFPQDHAGCRCSLETEWRVPD